ncbi:MAG: NAD(P)/FAD-dependent oxidoreductase [Pseudomonadales bacterium]|nr:NAD(P)/FAD-dependent oxidoreductase [Pseudomonadales bacterium]
MEKIQADYLVVGSGAMGMAFTDVLMTETDATVVIVDRHHQPGGHWNDAYPYVRLHQPSAFYGVNSKHLGSDHVDTTGWNQGLYELATNSEVVAYFDQVMQQQFLASGRVQYFPNCEYGEAGSFKSLVSGVEYQVKCDKIVNATYMNVTVPSIRPPAYEVEDGVDCVPPNQLPRVQGQYSEYVVVGAGKTGMDACLFLLKNNVDPSAIRWIMPRDSWILDRANIQPSSLEASTTASVFAQQAKALAEAKDFTDAFDRAESSGALIRFDPNVWPTMYRCATVTHLELDQLRRIEGVVRQGRVIKISTDEISLEQGVIPTNARTLHIDCSADGLQTREPLPVFDGSQITLQSVRTCQQVFSAAFIAHVEAAYEDVEHKNELCSPVPHPDTDVDFLKTSLANSLNTARWAEDPELSNWLAQSRLDGFSQVQPDGYELDEATLQQLEEMQAVGRQTIENIQRILAAL